MTVSLIGMARETRVPQAHKRSGADTMRPCLVQAVDIVRLEFPANHSFEVANEVSGPGMYQQSRRIYFKIFALQLELPAVARNALIRPLSPNA